MFNSKKGVSEVVANVLIVLLVIVGIAVIWSVVKPTIDKGAKSVQADCFTVSVEPVECKKDTTGNWKVTVKRNPGAGVIDSVELLFDDGTNSKTKLLNSLIAVTGTDALTELSTKTVGGFTSADDSIGFSPKRVNTVLRVGGQLCQVTSQPVNCA